MPTAPWSTEHACDVLLRLWGTSSSRAPPAACVHLVAVGGRLERGLSKVRALEGVKLQMGLESKTCGKRLVAQVLVERCWSPYARRSHMVTQTGRLRRPVPTQNPWAGFSPPSLAPQRLQTMGGVPGTSALHASGRGFIPHCGGRGEMVLSGVRVLREGTTIRAGLLVTAMLLGRQCRTGQGTTTSAPACLLPGRWLDTAGSV